MSKFNGQMVAALNDGFGGNNVRVERGSPSKVYVDGFPDPIVVHDDQRIEVPDCFGPATAGIRLDYQAVCVDL